MIPAIFLVSALTATRRIRRQLQRNQINGAGTSSIPLPIGSEVLPTCLTCPHDVAAPLQPRCCHSNLNMTASDLQLSDSDEKRDKAAIRLGDTTVQDAN